MRKPYIYCTIDTETVGGASRPTGMYNLGAVIHDKDGNIFATLSLLVMEHYDEIAMDDYAKQNFHLYEQYLESGVVTPVQTEAEALLMLRMLCREYGVKYLICYNTGFDLCKTCCRELLDEFEFIDAYLMALETITHKKSYAKFCRENGYRSRSGKSCATSAESVYAYINGNGEYVEEHTALADALIECEIFAACYRMHKRFTKNCHQWDCKDFSRKCFPKWEAPAPKPRMVRCPANYDGEIPPQRPHRGRPFVYA